MASNPLSARSVSLIAVIALLSSTSPALAQPAVCPAQGDAKQALARELNFYKNRETAPTPAEINPQATLPAVLAAGPDLTRWSRSQGAIFIGVVLKVKPGGYESANCHARALSNRDTHIEIALDLKSAPSQRLIVEITPWWRAHMAAEGVDWSTAKLRTLVGHQVRVTGWLFDDLEHVVSAENTHPHGAHNWRATVWEIHPVTALEALPESP